MRDLRGEVGGGISTVKTHPSDRQLRIKNKEQGILNLPCRDDPCNVYSYICRIIDVASTSRDDKGSLRDNGGEEAASRIVISIYKQHIGRLAASSPLPDPGARVIPNPTTMYSSGTKRLSDEGSGVK
jgi:hypothetical protein